MIEVCFLKSEELPIWVALRIEALAEAPGAFGDTVDQAKGRSPEEWRESLLDRGGALLLAYELGLPVGMARVSRWPEKPNSAGLYSMWVAPVARRKGVGKALMDAALVWADQQKFDEMILFVTQGNAAKRLYLRAGFVETGRTVPLRSNPEIQMEEMARQKSCSSHVPMGHSPGLCSNESGGRRSHGRPTSTKVNLKVGELPSSAEEGKAEA